MAHTTSCMISGVDASTTAAKPVGAGITLYSCRNNTVEDVTVCNLDRGIAVAATSDGNIIRENVISNNVRGIEISTSNDNTICNNNFIDNATHAYVYANNSTGNLFSLPEYGGNYWSNWTSPDADGDGFVDNPYVFTGGQDDLPWAAQNGWLASGWTPPGANVIVQPVDETTGQVLANLTFDSVSSGGTTTLTSMTPGENHQPPQGFRFGTPPVIFQITTAATFAGEVEVCFDYSGMSFHNESSLKLFHSSDGSGWTDITSFADTENDVICGLVTSFSFFTVVEVADPAVLIEALTERIAALNLQHGIDNSLDAKLDAALNALDDINENNDVAAINSLQAFINTVEAQRGKQISDTDADALIADAQNIIELLSS